MQINKTFSNKITMYFILFVKRKNKLFMNRLLKLSNIKIYRKEVFLILQNKVIKQNEDLYTLF